MNARDAILTMATNIPRAAARRFALSVAVPLGLMLATAGVTGQDRVRIVEAPRTAMRETRAATPQPRQPSDQPRRAGVPDQTSAVYAEHFVTEMQEQYRTVYVPVIESQTEPTPAWWNPLGLSTRKFRPRPVVRWEKRVEKVRVPVRYREMVSEPTVLPRTARSSSSPNGSTTPAAGNTRTLAESRLLKAANSRPTIVLPESQFGGVSRLESDQPRFGARPGLQGPPR